MKTNRLVKILCFILVLAFLIPLFSTQVLAVKPQPPPLNQIILDHKSIPAFVQGLGGPPPIYVADSSSPPGGDDYTVYMDSFQQQILPPVINPFTGVNFPMTNAWGYGGDAVDAITGAPIPANKDGHFFNSPGASFEAVRNRPVNVTWVNNIGNEASESHMFAVDPTLHWANPNNIPMEALMADVANGIYPAYPPGYDGTVVAGNPNAWDAQNNVPVIPHLHGGEVNSSSDGNPDAWFTWDGTHGPGYNTIDSSAGTNAAVFNYPNQQLPATLWYHDHALGITRINVMSGLAGFYFLRDPVTETFPLPDAQFEMPLAIQDRTFTADGQFFFDSVGINPTDHPYWLPEFFGNTIMVNGKVWPFMDVGDGWYRFRLLDGSNARFYTIQFWDKVNGVKLNFYQIGTDGGYLPTVAGPMNKLTIAPGERCDILINFGQYLPGTAKTILMSNSAKSPFPDGASPDPKGVGQIMQFRVDPLLTTWAAPVGYEASLVAANLNPEFAPLVDPVNFLTPPVGVTVDRERTLVLWEVMGPGGPLEILLNGLKWGAPTTETPDLYSTEDWVIINPTADTHPIHLHLVQFQVVFRQKIDTKSYVADWLALNAALSSGTPIPGEPPYVSEPAPVGGGGVLSLAPYLKNKPIPPAANEIGWKDTIQMNPGEVTVVRARFMPIETPVGAVSDYPFNATWPDAPGYVWHCHILDHEDNEMMRPYIVNWVAKPV
jgi:spore coat protein A